MAIPQYTMFIDDTGDVTNSTTNAPAQRYASVTGVIFERAYLTDTFEPGFQKVVAKYFGCDADGIPPVLHRRKMISPPLEGPFACLRDLDHRARWNRSCLAMMKRADYAVITVCLDKVSFYYHHPKATLDVYETLIQNALERYFYFLKARSAVGDVFVEAQNPGTDEIIKNRYRKAVADGTEFISGPKLQSVLTSREVNIAPKRRGLPGLQMADLLARPAFAHCRAVYTGDSGDLKGFAAEVAPILEALKFYRDSSGNPDRYGRCWRPALKR